MLFRQRKRTAMDKMRHATRRFVQFCDNTIAVRDDDNGKTALRELRRFLTRDVPRYFRRLPIPHTVTDIKALTLRDWLYLSPLLLMLLIIAQRSVYALLGIVFLILLVDA